MNFKILVVLLVLTLVSLPINSAHSDDDIPLDVHENLDAFAMQIFTAHANKDIESFLKLWHPDCPAPYPERLEYQFQSKWLTEDLKIRLEHAEQAFDFDKINFTVTPDYHIAFQVWQDKDEPIELITGFPVTQYGTSFKIVDYPCWNPK